MLVIGAGAGGSAAVRKLAGHNLDILCLEQGDFLNYSSLPSNYLNWFSLGNLHLNAMPKKRKELPQIIVNDDESPIKVSFFNGVGGSTILYSGHYPRFHPKDFECKDSSSSWPISYAEIEPFYDENQKYTPVAGLEGDPAYPTIRNLLPPVPLGPMGERIASGFNSLGWHWWPSYSAIATREFGHHGKCINLGNCNFGCPQMAKGSSDISHWRDSLKLGVRIRTGCTAKSIQATTSGEVQGAIYEDGQGQLVFQPAKVVILAAGGIGSPVLLLNSKTSIHVNGLANSNGLIGKNLMMHPLAYVEGIYEENLDSDLGPQGCCIASHEFVNPPESRLHEGGYTLQVLRGPGLAESALRMFKRGLYVLGKNNTNDLVKFYNHTAQMSVIVEDLPDLQNQVYIDDKGSNSKIGIRYKLSHLSKKRLVSGMNAAKEVLRESGAVKITEFAPVPDSGWHIMGTCRMGKSPDNSVVNAVGETHEIKNLFIADSSVFSSASSVNPAATVHALGLLVAAEVLKRLI